MPISSRQSGKVERIFTGGELITPSQYELAFYAQTVWRLAFSSDVNELTAVACTVRNHVIPKMGQITDYDSYLDACEAFLNNYPVRENPTRDDIAFFSRPDGILYNIERIYNCEQIDITATHDQPAGAKYFARVISLAPDDWRKIQIVNRPTGHPLLGTFGSMQFYA